MSLQGAWSNEIVVVEPVPGESVPTVLSHSVGTSTGTLGFGVVVTKPEGTVEGDLLVAYFRCRALPEEDQLGWTFLALDDLGNNNASVWWKIAGTGEPDDYTFLQTEDAGRQSVGLLRINGHHGTNPLETYGVNRMELGDPADTVHTAPSVEIPGDNRLALRFYGNTEVVSFTAEAGLDTHFDSTTNRVAILSASNTALAPVTEEAIATTPEAIQYTDSWTVVVAPSEHEELGDAYLIFRRTPSTGEPFDPEVDTPIATVPSNQLTYDDEGLAEGEYEWQVFARKVD